MKLGDFFKAGPNCQPVNPKPVEMTLVSKATILPGGVPNPSGRVTRAKATAAFTYLDGDATAHLRVEARRSLRERFRDAETGLPADVDAGDYDIEFMYMLLASVLREWDAPNLGGPFFEAGVEQARELLTVREANRLLSGYNAYVADEHPEVVDKATFRDAGKRGPRMAVGKAG